MFNRVGAYDEVGRRVAEATNAQDGPRAAMERDYFKRMYLCEKPGLDRETARRVYDAAFKSARKIPKVPC